MANTLHQIYHKLFLGDTYMFKAVLINEKAKLQCKQLENNIFKATETGILFASCMIKIEDHNRGCDVKKLSSVRFHAEQFRKRGYFQVPNKSF